MGQLEPYGVNEMYLAGMMLGLFMTYVAEIYESNTFESLKAYFYSTNLINFSRKSKRVINADNWVCTPDKGIYSSWLGLNTKIVDLEMTKVIDNFVIWQDPVLIDFKVDEHVLRLQRKFSWS